MAPPPLASREAVREERLGDIWSNDLNDVSALAIAVPYCDVVITEKSWASMLTVAKVPERFETTVTRSLHDVADRLA